MKELKHLNYEFSNDIDAGKLEILTGDALTEKWPNHIDAVVANIPYQISSPLIEKLSIYQKSNNSVLEFVC